MAFTEKLAKWLLDVEAGRNVWLIGPKFCADRVFLAEISIDG